MKRFTRITPLTAVLAATLIAGIALAATPALRVNGLQIGSASSSSAVGVTSGVYWNSVDDMLHVVSVTYGDRPIDVLTSNYGIDTLNARPLQFGATNATVAQIGTVSHPIGLGINTLPAYSLHVYGGGARIQGLSAPGTPVVSATGGTGTGWCYQVVAVDAFGNRSLPTSQQCTSGNATLDATHYMTISISAVDGATGYDYIRTGGALSSGAIALNTTALTFNDTGMTAATYTVPTRNATADLTIDGSLGMPTNESGLYGLGTTATEGFILENLTAATAGTTEQMGPCLTLAGQWWNTTAVASQRGAWDLCARPRSGSAANNQLSFYSNVNGAGASEVWRLQNSTMQFMQPATEIILGSAANAALATNIQITPGSAYTSAGATTLALSSSNASNTGRIRLGMISGAGAGFNSYGEDLTCTGTCNSGSMMCWAGSDGATVAQCAATANLTTIAGVAVSTVTNAGVTVARHGRAQVACDTGTAIGIAGTSSTTSGRVSNTVSSLGALIGHITKAEASNLCIINLEL